MPVTRDLWRPTYSQYGQDVLAEYLLKKSFPKRYVRGFKGRYLDVGACWPVRVSNTYFFYEKGWRGLCLDANPAGASAFAQDRPEDIFIGQGVSDEPGELTLYTFTNAQWNSFNPSRAKSLAGYQGEIKVPVRPLSDIIDEHLGEQPTIDLASIDTEGFEMKVLRSIDFRRHRPRLLLLESIKPVMEAQSDPIVTFLGEHGYVLKSHTGHDAFFLDTQAKDDPPAAESGQSPE